MRDDKRMLLNVANCLWGAQQRSQLYAYTFIYCVSYFSRGYWETVNKL